MFSVLFSWLLTIVFFDLFSLFSFSLIKPNTPSVFAFKTSCFISGLFTTSYSLLVLKLERFLVLFFSWIEDNSKWRSILFSAKSKSYAKFVMFLMLLSNNLNFWLMSLIWFSINFVLTEELLRFDCSSIDPVNFFRLSSILEILSCWSFTISLRPSTDWEAAKLDVKKKY